MEDRLKEIKYKLEICKKNGHNEQIFFDMEYLLAELQEAQKIPEGRSTDGNIICPKCKHVMNADRELNGNNDKTIIRCGVCTVVIQVHSIVEYEYGLLEDEDYE